MVNDPRSLPLERRPSDRDLRSRFEQDGYVVIDTEIPETVLARAVADLEPWLRRARRVQDGWRRSEAVRAIATWPRVLEALQVLYGDRPRPFQTLNFRVGTEQAVHSDTIHFDTTPPGRMCGVWVALEDIDEDNGPLVYYPGSHLWPQITMDDVERAGYFRRDVLDTVLTRILRLGASGLGASRRYPAYERYVADLVARSGARPAYGTISRGQAIVWASNLLHGGAPQRDRSRTRKSQVTHYFFGGARYWTPLLSHGKFRYRRRPRWIDA